jgi:hypothetical protein
MWDRALGKLKCWLQENLAHPEMSNAIIKYLDGWRNDVPVSVNISQEWIQQAFSGQSMLGWRNLLLTRVMATDPADIFCENWFSPIAKTMDRSPDSEVMGSRMGYVGAPEWNSSR